jgi:DNA-binding MarR family transcriptional regulator
LSVARYLKDDASMKKETCICTVIRNASRQITMMYDAALSPVDLRITQFTVLRILRKLGPLSVTRLADAGGLDRSTMGRNLDPLERRGLVGFTQGKDQRQRLAHITSAGEAAIAMATPLWEGAQKKARLLIPAATLASIGSLVMQTAPDEH